MSTPELKPNMTISQGSMLAPGIVSLFIQGLEAGLVITQFLKWLSRWEGGERSWIVVLVFFVTLVGFVQTGVIFASVWRDYVQNFGQPIYPRWTESIQIALTLLMAAPVQSFLIWRCHHVVKLSYYVTTLLVAALIGSLVLAVWVSTHIIIINSAGLKQKNLAGVWYPLLLYNTLPSLLDLSLNVILLSYLMRSLNRVYTVHARRRINRLMVVSWQAALPPSISSLVTMITYIIYVTVYPTKPQLWMPTLQEVQGKLYILSLFFTLNSRAQLTHNPPMTYLSTIPMATESPAHSSDLPEPSSTSYTISVRFPDGLPQ